MTSDAALARRLQHENDCKSAGRDSGLQSVKSISALQAEPDTLQADIEKLRPVSTSFLCLPAVCQVQLAKLRLT